MSIKFKLSNKPNEIRGMNDELNPGVFSLANKQWQLMKSVNAHIQDELYPSASFGPVKQWQLKNAVSARLVCIMNDYMKDRYKRLF